MPKLIKDVQDHAVELFDVATTSMCCFQTVQMKGGGALETAIEKTLFGLKGSCIEYCSNLNVDFIKLGDK